MSTSSIGLILFTNSTALAADAKRLGIDRVMVDLEYLGKAERQNGMSLRLSGHTMADLAAVSEVVDAEDLMVRVDPWHAASSDQIEQVLQHEPGTIMLPMVRHASEVASFADAVAGRASLSLLIETHAAVEQIDDLLGAASIAEIHIGLNDLRIDMGNRFLFEAVADNTLDPVFRAAQVRSVPCGLGGIARLDEGLVPGRMVLGELIYRNASAVILSRTFVRGIDASFTEWDRAAAQVVEAEVGALRNYAAKLRTENPAARQRRHNVFTEGVRAVVAELDARP